MDAFFVRYSCILRLKGGKVSGRVVFLTTDGGTSVTLACLSPDIVVLHAKEGRRREQDWFAGDGSVLFNCIFFYFGTCCEAGQLSRRAHCVWLDARCTVTAACGIHPLEVSAFRSGGPYLCSCRCFAYSFQMLFGKRDRTTPYNQDTVDGFSRRGSAYLFITNRILAHSYYTRSAEYVIHKRLVSSCRCAFPQIRLSLSIGS